MPKKAGIQLNETNENGEILDLKINVQRDALGKIVRGIVVGDTLEQNKALILMMHQGEDKFNPDLGVGIEDLLLSEDYLEFRHKIREHFAKDGLKVGVVDLYPNKAIKIDANY